MVHEHPPFLDLVEAFLARTGLAPTKLGRDALGDPNFVRNLRDGRKTFRDTENRLILWMKEYEQREPGAPPPFLGLPNRTVVPAPGASANQLNPSEVILPREGEASASSEFSSCCEKSKASSDQSTAPTRPADIAICPACESRIDTDDFRACGSTDCPMAARKAA